MKYNMKISQEIMNISIPDSKDHGTNMGPIWVLSAPGGPHVGPMNLAIRDIWRGDTTGNSVVKRYVYIICQCVRSQVYNATQFHSISFPRWGIHIITR